MLFSTYGVTIFFVIAMAVVAIVLASIAYANQGNKKRKSCKHSQYKKGQTLQYYLNIDDFASSFIEIPTSNVTGSGSPTIASSYLAGRAPLFTLDGNVQVGTCSASFLNMQTSENIFTDISNYISTVDGLIVTWFTPTTLLNLALDSVINGMVTEAIVKVTTKVGASRFFGKTYDMVVSSDGQHINFKFTPTS